MGKKKANKGSTKTKFDAEEVSNLLRLTYGNVLLTAQSLGANRQTVYNYIERHARVKNAMLEGRESLVDLAEGKTVQKVKAGEWPAIKEVLSKLGKKRGWGDSIEHTGPDGKVLKLVTIKIINSKPDGVSGNVDTSGDA